jgi:hypothetical protein
VGTGAVVRGNNENDGRVFELLQAAGGLSAVEMREMQVHEDQLWGQRGGEENCLTAICGGANDLETGLFSHYYCKGLKHEGGVINQKHLDAIRLWCWPWRILSALFHGRDP